MDFNKLANGAKKLLAQRGGVKGVEGDAQELKDIVSGDGSMTQKAEEAFEALKVPGAADAAAPEASTPPAGN
jgi:hypothetical protein